MKADKYSGLVTSLAVLIAVFYAEGEYDGWDIFLGVVGFILGMKYISSIDGKDLFSTFLASALISIGIVSIIFGIIQQSSKMQDVITKTPFGSSFLTFISLSLVLTAFTHIKRMKQPNNLEWERTEKTPVE